MTTRSVEETRRLGEELGRHVLRPGDLVILSGGLGAGKTALAQGIGAGLGAEGPVVSPTFTLVRTYPGPVTLVHADVYRLDRVSELDDLGLDELPDPASVVLVEWGDVVGRHLPPERLEVELSTGEDDERVIALRPVGERWWARREHLERAARVVGPAGGGGDAGAGV